MVKFVSASTMANAVSDSVVDMITDAQLKGLESLAMVHTSADCEVMVTKKMVMSQNTKDPVTRRGIANNLVNVASVFSHNRLETFIFFSSLTAVKHLTNYNLTDIVTPIDRMRLADLLRQADYPEEEISFLKEGFETGFDLCYRGPTNRKDRSTNIPFTVGNKCFVGKNDERSQGKTFRRPI